MWDTTLIRAMEYNWPTFVDDLESGWLTTDAAKNDSKDDPVTWADTMPRTHSMSGQMPVRRSINPIMMGWHRFQPSATPILERLGLARVIEEAAGVRKDADHALGVDRCAL
jgi:hypothetical protein